MEPLRVQPVYFGGGDAQKALDGISPDLRSVLGDMVSLLSVAVVSDRASAARLDDIISPEADALLALNLPVWGERLARIGKPILLWSAGGYYGAWTRDRVSFLRSKGAEVYDFVTPQEARETIRALRAVSLMRGSAILYFGEPAGLTGRYEMAGVMGSCWDFEAVREKIGPSVKLIPNSHLLQIADSIPHGEAKETIERWRGDFERIENDWEGKLIEVARLYGAMKELLSINGANALTINCLSDLFKRRFVTPCIALARLLDEGSPAGCEGDLNTLLTMMLFHFISEETPIMGNIYLFRPQRGPGFPPQDVILEDTKLSLKYNRARFTHDVIPLKPALTKYRLADYHNSGRGVTAYAELPRGMATFGRIDPRLDRIVFTVARIESTEDSVHCRFSAWLKMRDTEGYVRGISSHHSAMVYGDWSSTLHRAAEMLKINAIEI